MRNFACFLLLCSGSVATLAAETWRWVDANGVTHFSDRPVAGAERVDLKANVVRSNIAPQQGASRAAASQPAPTAVVYTRCVVTAPANDQTFQNPQNVQVSLEIEPALQSGHRIEVLLNGRPVPEWPAESLSYSLVQVYRGSYTLTARVLDEQSKQLCIGPATSFHVRQPTVNSPARRPAGG